MYDLGLIGPTQEQKAFLDEFTFGKWTFNPRTGHINVTGSFNCAHENLYDLKGIEFGTVTGDFTCSYNHLTDLKGSPRKVMGNFICCDNNLTSLEGAPQVIGGDFFCSRNLLNEPAMSMKGAPEKVHGDVFSHGNPGF